ncbi:SMODS domain-containing nucleotidyltransferase [Pelotomaculum propionicicum]|uniref:SMODS domain-containing nucleotidyltransferase n=1 Tax=Pelotomaculum propionicicum TaxID=258475 RepID=UPI003B824BE4
MPNNIDQIFKEFAEKLVLPADRLKPAIEKSRQVSEWAKRKIKSHGSFFGGSYRRGTDIPQESLKLHLLLSRKHYYDSNENSTKLLFFLKKRLSEDYHKPVINGGGTVVRLYSPPEAALDLLPTIRISSGGYLVPNGQGGWYKTNPGKEEALFKMKDDNSSGKFLKLAKIMKTWNINAGHPFDAYFLELVVYYRVNDFLKIYPDLVHSLFVSMRLFLPEFLNCPAAGEVISSGTGSGVRQTVLCEAERLTLDAVKETEVKNALAAWQSVLGGNFGAG